MFTWQILIIAISVETWYFDQGCRSSCNRIT